MSHPNLKRTGVRTRRLHIRPYRLNDYAASLEANTTRLPPKNKFDQGPVPPDEWTLRDFKKMLARQEKIARRDFVYVYGVFEKKTGKLIGGIDIMVICRMDRQFSNLGYKIHNRYWGRGYGKESAKAALKIAFSQLYLNQVEAVIDIGNDASEAVAKGIGMRPQGIKERYLFENGKWLNQIVYLANPRDVGLRSIKPKIF